MKLAYLLSQYPTLGHTYLLRELRGLRALEGEIPTVSIRLPDRPIDDMPAAEREEGHRTPDAQAKGAFGALLAADQFQLRSIIPPAISLALRYAIRMGGFDLRKGLHC